MEPIEQIQVFVFILIAGFRSKKLLHPFVLRGSCPFFAEHLIDQAGCLAVCRIVGTDERTVGKAVVLLCVMPEQEPNVFVVDLVIIIMIIRRVERQVFAVQGFVLRNERAPDIQAGNHVFEIGGHTYADLLHLVLLERIGEIRLFQHSVNTVCNISIIEVSRI